MTRTRAQRSPRRRFRQGPRWLAGMKRAIAESEAKLEQLREQKARQQQQPQAQLLRNQQAAPQQSMQPTNKETQ